MQQLSTPDKDQLFFKSSNFLLYVASNDSNINIYFCSAFKKSQKEKKYTYHWCCVRLFVISISSFFHTHQEKTEKQKCGREPPLEEGG
jgi:hypothetical protein